MLAMTTYIRRVSDDSQFSMQTCQISDWLLTLLTKVSSIFALLVATVFGREEEGVV